MSHTFESVVIDESNCHISDKTNDTIDDLSQFLNVLYESKKFQLIGISNILSLIKTTTYLILLLVANYSCLQVYHFLLQVN